MVASRLLLAFSAGLVALVLPCTAPGTTWTVCPVGGGCSFPDIQSAIDAASAGDTILVLPGTYAPFVLNKALRILGVGPSLVTVTSPSLSQDVATVTGIPVGEFAILAGMSVPMPAFPFGCFSPQWAAVQVVDSPGGVVLSNLQINAGNSAFGVRVASSRVILDHVTTTGVGGGGVGFSGPGCTCTAPGLDASGGSDLSANESSFRGIPNSPGVRTDGTIFSTIARSAMLGASGNTFGCGCGFVTLYQGCPGGHGFLVSNGGDARVAGGPLAIAQGGGGGPGAGVIGCFPVGTINCPAGTSGSGVVASGSNVLLAPDLPVIGTSGSTIVLAPAPLPSVGVDPPLVVPGGAVTFSVSGPAGFEYFLGAAPAPSFLPITGVGGPLLLDPSLLIEVASGTLDSTGAASISVAVPPDPGLSTAFLLFQAATQDPASGALDLSPAALVVIL